MSLRTAPGNQVAVGNAVAYRDRGADLRPVFRCEDVGATATLPADGHAAVLA